MCIGDWRAGALIRAETTRYSLGPTVDRIISPNPQRVGITLLSDTNSPTVGAVVSIDDIISFQIGGVALVSYHFTLATHGDLPTRKFTLTGQGVGSTGAFIEYIAPQAMMVAAIEEFLRSYPTGMR